MPEPAPPFEPDRRTLLALGLASPFCFGRSALTDPVELALRWSAASEEDVRDLAAEALRDGLSVEGLNGAVLLAVLHDIPPVPMGGPLHAAMVVESAIQLTAAAGERERLTAGLWCLGDYLDYRVRIRATEPWSQPPEATESYDDIEGAAAELVAAMEAWDAERADRAVTWLAHRRPASELFEVLRPYSARCFSGVGHKLLYAVQLERVLERLDARIAVPALRSLVACLIHPETARDTAAYARSRTLAAELAPGADPRSGSSPGDTATAVRLARDLRGCSAFEAQDLVVRYARAGLDLDGVWDGLRLFGSDVFLRRAPRARLRHVPVHTVTETNAFDTSRRRARDPRWGRVFALQAAAWQAELVAVIEREYGAAAEGEGLSVTNDARRAPKPEILLRTATQDHQLKYAAAAIEEAHRGPESYRQVVLSAGFDYLPSDSGAATPRYERAIETLKRSGRG